MFLAQKVGNKGMHSGCGKQHGGIIVRYKGLALNLDMAF
jgi:hypothetical protein